MSKSAGLHGACAKSSLINCMRYTHIIRQKISKWLPWVGVVLF